ncbi:hypothetical protein Tco_0220084, partial [Tanacetum coccineum]
KKSNNSDEGCMEMGELKDDLTLIKSKLQMLLQVAASAWVILCKPFLRILSLLPLCLGMTEFLLALGSGSFGTGSLTDTAWLSTAIPSLAAVCEL